jgi:hypothetical protein
MLWREKLLVTPGDVARFVSLPGNVGVESAVSVYKAANGKPTTRGGYWLTVTQPSARLWDCIAEPGVGQPPDASKIAVERCDLELPESTALAVRRVWLSMLVQARPDPRPESIPLDNSTEVFSANDDNGKLLRGKIPSGRIQRNNSALLDIANSLIEYCNVTQNERAAKARKIEKKALKLLGWVSKS